MNSSCKKSILFYFLASGSVLAIKAGAAPDFPTSGQLFTDFSSLLSKELAATDFMKQLAGIRLLELSSGVPEQQTPKCLVNVLPGDSQNLLENMANVDPGCALRIKGKYVFSTLPPTVNRKLLADRPVRQQGGDSQWYSPVVYGEYNQNVFFGSLMPVDTEPAATLVINQGMVTLDEGGELHNIGIIDHRPEANIGRPVFTLTRPSTGPIKMRLPNVHYKLAPGLIDPRVFDPQVLARHLIGDPFFQKPEEDSMEPLLDNDNTGGDSSWQPAYSGGSSYWQPVYGNGVMVY